MAARTDMAVESGNVSFQYDWDKKVQGMIYRKLFVDDDLAKRLKKGKEFITISIKWITCISKNRQQNC